MNEIRCLLTVIGTLMLLTALSGPETQSAAQDDFRFDAATLKDKSLWNQVNAEPYYISAAVNLLCRAPTTADYASERKVNPHAASFITVYVNNVGREAMFSRDVGRFPEGSVIVKEKIGVENRKTLLYTIMRKRERGYNPAVGDWEFAVVAANGTQVEASGKLENCQACHKGRSNSDFIFRPYLKSE